MHNRKMATTPATSTTKGASASQASHSREGSSASDRRLDTSIDSRARRVRFADDSAFSPFYQRHGPHHQVLPFSKTSLAEQRVGYNNVSKVGAREGYAMVEEDYNNYPEGHMAVTGDAYRRVSDDARGGGYPVHLTGDQQLHQHHQLQEGNSRSNIQNRNTSILDEILSRQLTDSQQQQPPWDQDLLQDAKPLLDSCDDVSTTSIDVYANASKVLRESQKQVRLMETRCVHAEAAEAAVRRALIEAMVDSSLHEGRRSREIGGHDDSTSTLSCSKAVYQRTGEDDGKGVTTQYATSREMDHAERGLQQKLPNLRKTVFVLQEDKRQLEEALMEATASTDGLMPSIALFKEEEATEQSNSVNGNEVRKDHTPMSEEKQRTSEMQERVLEAEAEARLARAQLSTAHEERARLVSQLSQREAEAVRLRLELEQWKHTCEESARQVVQLDSAKSRLEAQLHGAEKRELWLREHLQHRKVQANNSDVDDDDNNVSKSVCSLSDAKASMLAAASPSMSQQQMENVSSVEVSAIAAVDAAHTVRGEGKRRKSGNPGKLGDVDADCANNGEAAAAAAELKLQELKKTCMDLQERQLDLQAELAVSERRHTDALTRQREAEHAVELWQTQCEHEQNEKRKTLEQLVALQREVRRAKEVEAQLANSTQACNALKAELQEAAVHWDRVKMELHALTAILLEEAREADMKDGRDEGESSDAGLMQRLLQGMPRDFSDGMEDISLTCAPSSSFSPQQQQQQHHHDPQVPLPSTFIGNRVDGGTREERAINKKRASTQDGVLQLLRDLRVTMEERRDSTARKSVLLELKGAEANDVQTQKWRLEQQQQQQQEKIELLSHALAESQEREAAARAALVEAQSALQRLRESATAAKQHQTEEQRLWLGEAETAEGTKGRGGIMALARRQAELVKNAIREYGGTGATTSVATASTHTAKPTKDKKTPEAFVEDDSVQAGTCCSSQSQEAARDSLARELLTTLEGSHKNLLTLLSHVRDSHTTMRTAREKAKHNEFSHAQARTHIATLKAQVLDQERAARVMAQKNKTVVESLRKAHEESLEGVAARSREASVLEAALAEAREESMKLRGKVKSLLMEMQSMEARAAEAERRVEEHTAELETVAHTLADSHDELVAVRGRLENGVETQTRLESLLQARHSDVEVLYMALEECMRLISFLLYQHSTLVSQKRLQRELSREDQKMASSITEVLRALRFTHSGAVHCLRNYSTFGASSGATAGDGGDDCNFSNPEESHRTRSTSARAVLSDMDDVVNTVAATSEGRKKRSGHCEFVDSTAAALREISHSKVVARHAYQSLMASMGMGTTADVAAAAASTGRGRSEVKDNASRSQTPETENTLKPFTGDTEELRRCSSRRSLRVYALAVRAILRLAWLQKCRGAVLESTITTHQLVFTRSHYPLTVDRSFATTSASGGAQAMRQAKQRVKFIDNNGEGEEGKRESTCEGERAVKASTPLLALLSWPTIDTYSRRLEHQVMPQVALPALTDLLASLHYIVNEKGSTAASETALGVQNGNNNNKNNHYNMSAIGSGDGVPSSSHGVLDFTSLFTTHEFTTSATAVDVEAQQPPQHQHLSGITSSYSLVHYLMQATRLVDRAVENQIFFGIDSDATICKRRNSSCSLRGSHSDALKHSYNVGSSWATTVRGKPAAFPPLPLLSSSLQGGDAMSSARPALALQQLLTYTEMHARELEEHVVACRRDMAALARQNTQLGAALQRKHDSQASIAADIASLEALVSERPTQEAFDAAREQLLKALEQVASERTARREAEAAVADLKASEMGWYAAQQALKSEVRSLNIELARVNAIEGAAEAASVSANLSALHLQSSYTEATSANDRGGDGLFYRFTQRHVRGVERGPSRSESLLGGGNYFNAVLIGSAGKSDPRHYTQGATRHSGESGGGGDRCRSLQGEGLAERSERGPNNSTRNASLELYEPAIVREKRMRLKQQDQE